MKKTAFIFLSLHCFAASSALSNKFPRTATRSLSFINSILKPVSTKNSILTCSFYAISLKSVKIEFKKPLVHIISLSPLINSTSKSDKTCLIFSIWLLSA